MQHQYLSLKVIVLIVSTQFEMFDLFDFKCLFYIKNVFYNQVI